jgi:TDG/mug DNA glycosylase family protein
MKKLPHIPHILPDVLEPGLALVFCGTAAGTVSAQRGHYYAHPHNKFWKTLHRVGLTPRLLAPAEFKKLPDWGIGLTDIAKTVCGMDKELPPGSLGEIACRALEKQMEIYQPGVLAFTSLTAGRRFLGQQAVFGEQKNTIGRMRIWVLPSPSPTAQWNWDEKWWQALAAEVKKFSCGR